MDFALFLRAKGDKQYPILFSLVGVGNIEFFLKDNNGFLAERFNLAVLARSFE